MWVDTMLWDIYVAPAVSIIYRDNLWQRLLVPIVVVCGGSGDCGCNVGSKIGGIEVWFRRRFDGNGHGGSFGNGWVKDSRSYHEGALSSLIVAGGRCWRHCSRLGRWWLLNDIICWLSGNTI